VLLCVAVFLEGGETGGEVKWNVINAWAVSVGGFVIEKTLIEMSNT